MMMERGEAHFCCQKAERESHQVFGSGRFSGEREVVPGVPWNEISYCSIPIGLS